VIRNGRQTRRYRFARNHTTFEQFFLQTFPATPVDRAPEKRTRAAACTRMDAEAAQAARSPSAADGRVSVAARYSVQ